MHFAFETAYAFLLSKRREMRLKCNEFRGRERRIVDCTRREDFV
jgi:hypothetical protein